MQGLKQDELLEPLQGAFLKLCSDQSSEVSYQLTYDQVYRLCKMNRQDLLITVMEDIVRKYFSNVLEDLAKQEGVMLGDDLNRIRLYLDEAFKAIDRLAEVALFLDINYCQRQQQKPLRNRLYEVQYQIIVANERIVLKITGQIYGALQEYKMGRDISGILETLKLLLSWDEKEEFLSQYIMPVFIPILKQSYCSQSGNHFQKHPLQAYLHWCVQQIVTSVEFFRANLIKKKLQHVLDLLQREIYGECVTKYLPIIYSRHQEQLFNSLSLPMLELLQFGKNKETEEHVQWFTSIIEKHLKQISLDDNQLFIKAFTQFYHRVNCILRPTQPKFDIHYRSIFAFQEWINGEKYSIDSRLNHHINLKINTDLHNVEEFIESCTLVFRLMKEKNAFQTVFRKLMLNRMLSGQQKHLKEEKLLIDSMEKECGAEWVLKINDIFHNSVVIKDEQFVPFLERKEVFHYGSKEKFNVIIVDEGSWPYELKSTKIKLHESLVCFAKQCSLKYKAIHKDRNVQLEAQVGVVLISFKYKQKRVEYLVSTGMANLLLHLADRDSLKLSEYLCETGYKVDEVEHIISSLQQRQMITVNSKEKEHVICLATELPDGIQEGINDTLSSNEKYKTEEKPMEELKAERKMMVEAILVRIMKSSKVLKRSELLERTGPLLTKKGYNFNVEFVKQSIDRLLDKEFIRELENDEISYIA